MVQFGVLCRIGSGATQAPRARDAPRSRRPRGGEQSDPARLADTAQARLEPSPGRATAIDERVGSRPPPAPRSEPRQGPRRFDQCLRCHACVSSWSVAAFEGSVRIPVEPIGPFHGWCARRDVWRKRPKGRLGTVSGPRRAECVASGWLLTMVATAVRPGRLPPVRRARLSSADRAAPGATGCRCGRTVMPSQSREKTETDSRSQFSSTSGGPGSTCPQAGSPTGSPCPYLGFHRTRGDRFPDVRVAVVGMSAWESSSGATVPPQESP